MSQYPNYSIELGFKEYFLILYSWFVRTITFFLPEIPFFQRFRGFLYSLGMKSCGKNFKVSSNAILNRLELLTVGNNVYFASNCFIAGGGYIYIGNNILFGPNVVLAAANHKFNGVNYIGEYEFGEIHIEDNCWIGANSVILKGAVIPMGCVVGASSVCNKRYEKTYSLIAGIPAKVITRQNQSSQLNLLNE